MTIIATHCLNFDVDRPAVNHPIRRAFDNLSKSQMGTRCLGCLKCTFELKRGSVSRQEETEKTQTEREKRTRVESFFILGLSGNSSDTEKVHKHLRSQVVNGGPEKVYVCNVSADKSIYAHIPAENVGTWNGQFHEHFTERYTRLVDAVASRRELYDKIGRMTTWEYKSLVAQSVVGYDSRTKLPKKMRKLSIHERKLVDIAAAYRKRLVWNLKSLKGFLQDSPLRTRIKSDRDWESIFGHFSEYGVPTESRPDIQTYFDQLDVSPREEVLHLFYPDTLRALLLLCKLAKARTDRKLVKTARKEAISMVNSKDEFTYTLWPPSSVREVADGLCSIFLGTQIAACDVSKCSALCDVVAQCAEDNVGIYLCHLLDQGLFKKEKVKSLNMEWYSTCRDRNGEQVHKPLCGLCENRFVQRLQYLISARLARQCS